MDEECIEGEEKKEKKPKRKEWDFDKSDHILLPKKLRMSEKTGEFFANPIPADRHITALKNCSVNNNF